MTKTSAISISKKKKNAATKQTPSSTPDVLQTETEISKSWQSVAEVKNLATNCRINPPQKSNNTNTAETSVPQTRINQLER